MCVCICRRSEFTSHHTALHCTGFLPSCRTEWKNNQIGSFQCIFGFFSARIWKFLEILQRTLNVVCPKKFLIRKTFRKLCIKELGYKKLAIFCILKEKLQLPKLFWKYFFLQYCSEQSSLTNLMSCWWESFPIFSLVSSQSFCAKSSWFLMSIWHWSFKV